MGKWVILKAGRKPEGLASQPGDYEEWIAAGMGLERAAVQVVDITTTAPLPAPTSVRAVVVTGSGAMVTDASPWMVRAAGWLAEVVAAGVPVLGICFGHQLLAHALGGEVGWNPQGVEVGTVEIQLQAAAAEDALFNTLPARFLAQVSHRQSVLRLPAGARRLAASSLEPVQAFAVGERAWGVQFHPEFAAELLPTYVALFQTQLAQEGQEVAALLAGIAPTPVSATLLARFAALA